MGEPSTAIVAVIVVRTLWLDIKAAICFYASMKTTVVLPDGIFRRAKAETAMRGRTLRAFILDAVVHELDGAAPDR
jgi:hypothetical protein